MSWALQRQLIIFSIFGAMVAAFVVVIFIATFYKTPTCTDGVQNQGEEGIDCGGSCTYLCTVSQEPPTVLFTQALPNGDGRTDIVALIENKNATAGAKGVPYTITLYGYDQALVQSVEGRLDLPPAATVPVFVPGVASGRQAVGTSFLTIDSSAVKWYTLPTDPRIVPVVLNTVLAGTSKAPRITATLGNAEVRALTNVKVVALVRDGSGNAIAASQTLVPAIPAQGQVTATFTWNAAFSALPVSIQVFPLVPLP